MHVGMTYLILEEVLEMQYFRKFEDILRLLLSMESKSVQVSVVRNKGKFTFHLTK